MTAIDRENLRRGATFARMNGQYAISDPDALIALLDRLEALEKVTEASRRVCAKIRDDGTYISALWDALAKLDGVNK